jgi:hypothetical protein
VVGQSLNTLSHANVPHLDKRVITASNNIGLKLLRNNGADRMRMARERMNLPPDPNIPNPSRTIPAPRNQHPQSLMNLQRINPTQMSMITPDNFVHFQVPTFD